MILAVAAAKGGVGKTTLAVHLTALAGDPARVCLVDADPNQSSSRWLAEAAPDIHVERAQSADDLLDGVPAIAADFDLVVVDAPGGSDESTRQCLLLCDVAILPVGPGALDLRAHALTVKLLRQAQAIRRDGGPVAFAVLNRIRKGTRLGAEARDLAASTGLEVLGTVVHERTGLADCSGQGTLAWSYSAASDSAAELRELVAEVKRRTRAGESQPTTGQEGEAAQ